MRKDEFYKTEIFGSNIMLRDFSYGVILRLGEVQQQTESE